MAMRHFTHGAIDSQLWMDAEEPLIKLVATAICRRHGSEIFGEEAVTPEFLENKWSCFAMEARDAIAIIRQWDAK